MIAYDQVLGYLCVWCHVLSLPHTRHGDWCVSRLTPRSRPARRAAGERRVPYKPDPQCRPGRKLATIRGCRLYGAECKHMTAGTFNNEHYATPEAPSTRRDHAQSSPLTQFSTDGRHYALGRHYVGVEALEANAALHAIADVLLKSRTLRRIDWICVVIDCALFSIQ